MESDREHLNLENHKTILIESLNDYFIQKVYVNVTLCCEAGEEITAHQTILAAYSPYFDKLLRSKSEHHPYLILDVSKEDMTALLEYMYKGTVDVPKTALPSLLKVAKRFKIRGFEHVKGAESAMGDTTMSTRMKLRSEPKSKVLNPFARSQKSLEDSDTTFCEEDFVRPGPSNLKAISPPTKSDDSDIEIIDTNPVVVVNESQQIVNSNPAWCSKTRPKNKKKVMNRDKPKNPDCEKESREEEVAVNPLSKTNKNSLDNMAIGYKLLKKKINTGSYSAEEHSELLKLPFDKLQKYCLVCRRFDKDETHFKKVHNKAPRKKIVCEKCSKSFYHKDFLKFHKCEPL